MLYDTLAEAHSDIAWMVFELSLELGEHHPALIKGAFALQRLERVVADLAATERFPMAKQRRAS